MNYRILYGNEQGSHTSAKYMYLFIHIIYFEHIYLYISLIINQNLIKQILAFNESLTPLNYHTHNSNKNQDSYFTLLRGLFSSITTLSRLNKYMIFFIFPKNKIKNPQQINLQIIQFAFEAQLYFWLLEYINCD